MKTFLKYTFPILTIIILVLAVWLSHQPGDISGRESAHLAQLLGVTDVFLRLERMRREQVLECYLQLLCG